MQKKGRIKIPPKKLPHFHPIVSIVTLILGILGTVVVSHVLAQTVSTTLYACTQNGTGLMRYVTNTTSCRQGETLISWVSGGVTTWGNITGTLSNQTDLQNALNGKQDMLTTYRDRHTKALTNNTNNDLFTAPLSDGEGIGVNIVWTTTVKKGSDWAISTGTAPLVYYNHGGTLHVANFFGTENDINNGVFSVSGNFNATLSNGVLTVQYNPGNVIASPDIMTFDYLLEIPTATVTFVP